MKDLFPKIVGNYVEDFEYIQCVYSYFNVIYLYFKLKQKTQLNSTQLWMTTVASVLVNQYSIQTKFILLLVFLFEKLSMYTFYKLYTYYTPF